VVGWNTYTLIEQAAQLPIGSFDADFGNGNGRRQVIEMFDAAEAAGLNSVRTWQGSHSEHSTCVYSPTPLQLGCMSIHNNGNECSDVRSRIQFEIETLSRV